MDSSDFLKKQEEDKDIKLFKEEHPDVYKFIVRLIDGQCDDKEIENFIEEYGEEVYNDIKKIVDREFDDEDVRRFKEKYPEEIYVAIQKMVEREAGRLSKAKPQITPYKKGDFIGQKYEVYDVLGMGGFGIVYLVYSHETKSAYALKTFRDEYLEDIKTRERFKKEAQVWIDLERHPYLVRAYFVDEISGRLYIAMEHIAADEQGMNTLEGYLRRRPPDLAQSLRWAIQFCYGMEYAYSKGIKAHRDIKPANIMIDQNKNVKVSDFGLAGIINTSGLSEIKKQPSSECWQRGLQTVAGTAFGTPPYMPPEQFENAADCDERSDIYSFGIVLYQMASGGALPFYPELTESKGVNAFQDWYRLHSKSSVPNLKSPLLSIIQKCLQKEPGKRYQTFRKLRTDLEVLFIKKFGYVIKPPELEELDTWELNNKGVSLSRLGKNEEAIACYDQAIKIDPMDVGVWLNKGANLNALNKYHHALICFDRALELNPKNANAWNNKATSLQMIGKYSEAIDCYSKALQIDPMNAAMWMNKGTVLEDVGEYQEAEDCYDHGIEIDPMDPGVWLNKGSLLDKLGKHREAIIYYDKALDINPQYAGAWNNKGNSLVNLDKDQEALACYDKAIEINHRDAEAWYNKGDALGNLGKDQESIVCYEKALEINPMNENAWYNKGIALDAVSEYQEAIACFHRVIEINPIEAKAWFCKGVALGKIDKHQDEIVCYDRALEINPTFADAWYSKGFELGRLGKYQEAIACFEKALEINPKYVGAWYGKALAEDGIGRGQDAAFSYKQFIELAPAQYAEQIEFARQSLRKLEEG